LASPHYGVRWGQHWLDVAGYADSNGYFNADTDRPLAYRYRDYVIRSVNRDTPFDRFVREQVAGDEGSGWRPGQPATAEMVELLEATHFLRNGQDGTGESDGNPEEVRTDRYYALESAQQILGSSLLGLTVQCAKCHDHKFEPFTQKDYYALQAVLYPAFPIEQWQKPNDRVVQVNLPGELEAWQATERELDAELAGRQAAFAQWNAAHRPPGRQLWADGFDSAESLAERWSATAPGDDAPGGSPPVAAGAEQGPAARVRQGRLEIHEGGGSGDRWWCTRETFSWRPAAVGQWIQVTFDLVADQLPGGGGAAERIGFFIAAHDFNHNSKTPGGNVLIDGHPSGPTDVQVDYPGPKARSRGRIGSRGYRPGHNYGVRITRTGADEYTLAHWVDGAPDGGSVKLSGQDLPPGAFGFEYCCGRSFVVDQVVVEASDDASPEWSARQSAYERGLADRRKELEQQTQSIASRRTAKPGRVAWVTDRSPEAPPVPFLKRGNHQTPGEPVAPAVPRFLRTGGSGESGLRITPTTTTTGRRKAWVDWLLEPGSVPAALVARVTVNRVWQQYFVSGLVATPDNLGLSGSRPTHPELLDWLAADFVASGWSLKALHRRLLDSSTFRQTSAPRAEALAKDPDNRWLWRFPVRRLDAEAVRDGMLAAAGQLGGKVAGPYVPTPRNGQGEVAVDEAAPEGFSRSVFLQHRRTQVPTFLGTFDAPSVVFNCTRRAATTMPLQSLSLLNSEFAVRRGADLARRLDREVGADPEARMRRAYRLTCGREPDPQEASAIRQFLAAQAQVYAGRADAEARVWSDFCQSLFGSNAFLYLE
jgi:hypothetical protein